MPIIIGLTGGIGSGKTTIIKHFENKGYNIYHSDEEGKNILKRKEIIAQLTNLFGMEIVENNEINRKKLANVVFNDADKLKLLNNIIHPAVKKDFQKKVSQLSHNDIIIKESAILIESGAYKDCNINILITAPVEIRIKRVMNRDKISENEVKQRIQNQMTDAEKKQYCDYVINNIDLQNSINELDKILFTIKNTVR